MSLQTQVRSSDLPSYASRSFRGIARSGLRWFQAAGRAARRSCDSSGRGRRTGRGSRGSRPRVSCSASSSEPPRRRDQAAVELALLLELIGNRFTGGRPQPVDAEPARELPDPRPDGVVGTQPSQVLVDARERVLEHVLRIGLAQPVSAGYGEDVAREPLDQLAPGGIVPGTTGPDDLPIADRRPVHRRARHSPILLRTDAADRAHEAAAVSRSSPSAVTRLAATSAAATASRPRPAPPPPGRRRARTARRGRRRARQGMRCRCPRVRSPGQRRRRRPARWRSPRPGRTQGRPRSLRGQRGRRRRRRRRTARAARSARESREPGRRRRSRRPSPATGARPSRPARRPWRRPPQPPSHRRAQGFRRPTRRGGPGREARRGRRLAPGANLPYATGRTSEPVTSRWPVTFDGTASAWPSAFTDRFHGAPAVTHSLWPNTFTWLPAVSTCA